VRPCGRLGSADLLLIIEKQLPQRYKNTLRTMSRKALLILLLMFSLGAAMLTSATGRGKAAQENHFREILAADPRIENVSFEGYEEEFGAYTILTVSFTIRGKPNSRITLLPYGDSDLNSLRVLYIGDLSPVMFEWDAKAARWSPRSPALGSEPQYRPPLPWDDMDLTKLVSYYDEVLKYFSKWPVDPQGTTVTTDGGLQVQCRVDPASASTMQQFVPPGD
jgi:hypothetical protein